MKKILERGYTCILFVFFTLFLLITVKNASTHRILFPICIIVSASFLTACVYILNKCKKITVRRWYLISMTLIALSYIMQSVFLLLSTIEFNDDTSLNLIYNIFSWVFRFFAAFSITSVIFQLFYTFKDFLKREYTIQKFDIHTIQMAINSLAFLIINFVIINYFEYEVIIRYNPVNFKPHSLFVYDFVNYNKLLNDVIFLICIPYICIYCLLEYIKYVKFEKQEIKSDRDFK